MDALRKLFNDKNCHEMAKLQYKLWRDDRMLSRPYRKGWLCDGTFISCQAERTFYHRPHLHENGATTRQVNPRSVGDRIMIHPATRRDTFSTWIIVSASAPEAYKPVCWNQDSIDLWNWITENRQPLMYVLLLEQKKKDGS